LIAVRSDWQPGVPLFRGLVDNRQVSVQIDHLNDGYLLTHGGVAEQVILRRPEVAVLAVHMPIKVAPDTSKYLLCPMPGLVISIEVEEGDEVKAGQTLAVVEAMKMENVLRAAEQRTVASVLVAPGESVSVDQPIIEFE
jgi:propionyl-CoA carboxylase alpha chain